MWSRSKSVSRPMEAGSIADVVVDIVEVVVADVVVDIVEVVVADVVVDKIDDVVVPVTSIRLKSIKSVI